MSSPNQLLQIDKASNAELLAEMERQGKYWTNDNSATIVAAWFKLGLQIMKNNARENRLRAVRCSEQSAEPLRPQGTIS